jgi:hypothetical protein
VAPVSIHSTGAAAAAEETAVHRSIPTAVLALLALTACSNVDGPDDGGPSGEACASGTGTLVSLDPGQVRVLSQGERSAFCVSGGAAGADFALIPVNTLTAAGSYQVDVLATSIVAVATTPNPLIAGEGDLPTLTNGALASLSGSTGAAIARPEPQRDLRFESKLRKRERDVVNAHLQAATAFAKQRARDGARLSATGGPSRASVAVGDLLSLNANANSGCSTPDLRTGRVAAVSQYAVIVADQGNPVGGFSDAEYASFAADFDTLVYPVLTDNFGSPSDLDANGGRSIIFFTRAVNEMTPAGATYYIGGFFFGRDLLPRASCTGSNVAEMFYMIVPDPNGVVNGNVRSKDFVQRITTGIIGHEFQHLINGAKKIENGQQYFAEDVWMNEGLSHIGEELLFYRTSGLSPRTNITRATLTASQRRVDAFLGYGISNFGRFDEFLTDPETQSPYADDDELATRGAAWSLLRYAADRKGGDEKSFWRALVGARVFGTSNLNQQTGIPTAEIVRDWAVANYADDIGGATDAEFTHPSWSFRSVFEALTDGQNPHGPLALKMRPLTDNVANGASLTGGGAAYYRFGVASGTEGNVSVTTQGAAPPAAVELALVRTR